MKLSICVVSASPQITVIAHMTNTPNAIRWALEQGANGIEMDLKFDGTRPVQFHHGTHCDCTCLLQFLSIQDQGCRSLGEGCSGSTSVAEMTDFLGSPEITSSHLALIYIDAKLEKSIRNYAQAGANVVRMINENVISRGYRGQILLGGSTSSRVDYLRGAIQEAQHSEYVDRYFYTIDSEGDNAEKVWDNSLQLSTNNVVYTTGITSCLPNTFYKAIQYSLVVSTRRLTFRSEFEPLIKNPERLFDFIGRDNIPPPGLAFTPKSFDASLLTLNSFFECDCSYFYRISGGGCAVTKSAPPDYACRCTAMTSLQYDWTKPYYNCVHKLKPDNNCLSLLGEHS
ncbi:hypothetical protein DAPPUDRAFT_261268 [Daphnia pulex]|uniref:GP-PDE domain-containing protein n=1 Tax=Daphnia pulex TaxID=6669 RepID=E9HKT1_DAPPU|nr:hypothetical protein DAPPUDRAFT_261268 [Daphnia pulex]|eukprot:EFX67662.1 hypothetical protein DAPPUDRAFT_261268 [Daphnia pulex]